jgi:CTP synthase
MAKQKKIVNKGGTMRLGSYRCNLSEKSITKKAYKKDVVEERHRHRYEFNSLFKDDFNKNGMMTTGINEKLKLVEVIELKNHPWFIGTQYHPEYKSRVLEPHPLFISFVSKIKSLKNG